VGLHWQVATGVSVFANTAHGRREPSLKEIYYASDYWSGPDIRDGNFKEDSQGLRYVGPEVKPEKVMDVEVGGRWSTDRFALDLALYWMDFRDEIVPWGGTLDDDDNPNNGNADQSRHLGVEVAGKCDLGNAWVVSGQGHFTRDRFIKHTEYSWPLDWGELIVVANYDDQTIPGYPQYVWNLRLDGRVSRLELWTSYRRVGRQYLDGQNLDDRSVDPYGVMDVGLSLPVEALAPMQRARAFFRVNNLLDTEYETAGYIEADDLEGRWFVGAPRNFYLGVDLEL